MRTRRCWRVRLEFKIEDMWIGAFWRGTPESVRGWHWDYDQGDIQVSNWDWHLWVCLVPCLPIHVICSTEQRIVVTR